MMRSSLCILLTTLMIFGWLSQVQAAAVTESNQTISATRIEVFGIDKTDPKVLIGAVDSRPGAAFDQLRLAQDMQRLLNYEIFETVTAVTEIDGDQADITIWAKDRWSTLPLFQPKFGGGIFKVKYGLRDRNIFGTNQELSLYVGNYISDTSSNWIAGFWWNIRQFMGRHLLYVEGNFDIRDDNYFLGTDEPQLRLQKTVKDFYARFIHKGSDLWQPGAFLYIADREYALLDTDTTVNLAVPDPYFGVRPGLLMKIGTVHYNNFRYHGSELLLGLYHELRFDDTDSFTGGFARLRSFWEPHARINLAFRAQIEARNSEFFTDDMAYGGFDYVRGYPDRYLRGRYAATLNTEVRILLTDAWLKTITTQLVPFYDVAYVGRDNFTDGDSVPAQGIGLGFRLMVVQIHGMFLRVDYARPIDRGDLPWDLGIGIQHFF